MDTALIDAVWEHGRAMPEADGATWRQDACGAWMRREQFGREADFGWKIEPIASAARTPETLRPFHWSNRYDIAAGRPHCRVCADRSGVPGEKYARPPRNREL